MEKTRQEIIGATDNAIDKFFESIQNDFPKIKSGILFKNTQQYNSFHVTCQKLITKWTEGEGLTK